VIAGTFALAIMLDGLNGFLMRKQRTQGQAGSLRWVMS
jgi:hypothetical protein